MTDEPTELSESEDCDAAASDESNSVTDPVMEVNGDERKRPFELPMFESGSDQTVELAPAGLEHVPPNPTTKAEADLEKEKAKVQRLIDKNQRLIDRVAVWSGGDAEVVQRAKEATDRDMWRQDWRFHCPVPRCTERFPIGEMRYLHVMGMKNARHEKYRNEHGPVHLSRILMFKPGTRILPPLSETKPKIEQQSSPSELNGFNEPKEEPAEVEDERILERITRHSSRSNNLLSEDGNEAAVKNLMLPGKKPHKKSCLMAVHPNELFQLRCTKRGCTMKANMMKAKAEYLWCRRRTRRTLGLLSVLAPLDSNSLHSINAAAGCIISNTSVAHLTFIEGLRIRRQGLYKTTGSSKYQRWLQSVSEGMQRLRTALFANPSVTINTLHTVPRLSDDRTALVIAEISMADAATNAVESLSRQLDLALPQFPLHITIGACLSTDAETIIAEASSRLVGLTLNVDAEHLSVLPPSLDERFGRQFSTASKPKDRHAAKRLATHTRAFETAIRASSRVANELNAVLMESAGAVHSCTHADSPDAYNLSTQHAIKAPQAGGEEVQEDNESVGEEARDHQEKIASLCAQMVLMEENLEGKGLASET